MHKQQSNKWRTKPSLLHAKGLNALSCTFHQTFILLLPLIRTINALLSACFSTGHSPLSRWYKNGCTAVLAKPASPTTFLPPYTQGCTMQTSTQLQPPSSSASPKQKAPPDLACVLAILVSPSTEADKHCYEELQTLRRQHDYAFERWLPHITLVPPFTLSTPSHTETSLSRASDDGHELRQLIKTHDQKLSNIIQAASEVCTLTQRHTLLLDQVATFPLRKYTNVHLRPFPTNFVDKRTASPPLQVDGLEDVSSKRIVDLQKRPRGSASAVHLQRQAIAAQRRQSHFQTTR